MRPTRSRYCLRIPVAAALFLPLTACAPPPASAGDFHSPDPGAKLYAITRAGQQRDAAAVPHLIEQLDSDDQAVRMYAILALERITGTRLGFIYYAPAAERRSAVQRWVDAYRKGGPDAIRQAGSANTADPAAANADDATAPAADVPTGPDRAAAHAEPAQDAR